MCLLVVRKAGSWKPSKEEFSNAWRINSDGFGIAYASGGKLKVNKSLTEKVAWDSIQRLPDNVPALLHWRMGTHGSASLNNVHPFSLPKVSDKRTAWVGAHNGVFSAIKPEGDITDSEAYFRTIKKLNIQAIEEDINRLGYGKVALLNNEGKLMIANEGQGSWRTPEVWQSNCNLDSAPYWSGFGFGRSYKPARSFDLIPLDCHSCGSKEVSYRSGRNTFLCELCADWSDYIA